MTKEFLDELLDIDNEQSARAFTDRYLAYLRIDPDLKSFSAEDIFTDDLHWIFGEVSLERKLSFDRIAIWAKIAQGLKE